MSKKESFPKSIIIILPLFLVCFLSLITFIISLIYYKIDKYKGVWDYLYMLNVSCFKIIEFQLLTLFGIFNSDDFLDASLLLVLERAIWTIIENILDNFEVNTKKLILIQIIFSSIIGIPVGLILFIILICIFPYIFKGRSGKDNNNQSSEKEKEKNVNIIEEFNLEEINIENYNTNSKKSSERNYIYQN